MKAYRSQFLELCAHLQSKLTNNDTASRQQSYSLYSKFEDSFTIALSQTVAEAQSSEAANIRAKKITLPAEKERLLQNINSAIYQISSIKGLLPCVTTAYRRGLNGCQEHATIISALLIAHFGVNTNTRVECIGIYSKHNKSNNHQFVVVGRNKDSNLEDISSWGEDCLIIDSWGGWVEGVANIPRGTGLASIKELGEKSGLEIRVEFDSRFKLDGLQHYRKAPDHLFHKIEAITYDLLREHISTALENFVTKLELPRLFSPTSIATSPHTFYQTVSTASREEEESKQARLTPI